MLGIHFMIHFSLTHFMIHGITILGEILGDSPTTLTDSTDHGEMVGEDIAFRLLDTDMVGIMTDTMLLKTRLRKNLREV